MGDIEAFLSAAEDPAFVRVATARILPPDKIPLLRQHAQLEADLDRAALDDARLNRDPQMPVIAERIAELERDIDAAKSEFRFRCIGTSAWLNLAAKHPPTKEQLKVNARVDHDPETFQPAAIAASCVEPQMTLDQAGKLRDVLTVEQWGELWAKCVEANIGGGDSPKSLVAGAILRVKERSATTAAPEAFPDPSSSVE